MRRFVGSKVACCAIVMMLGFAANARADFITAYGWVSFDGGLGGADASASFLAGAGCHWEWPTQVAAIQPCTTGPLDVNGIGTPTNPNVTFTTSGINLKVDPNNPFIQNWLNSSLFPIDNEVTTAPAPFTDDLMGFTTWLFTGTASFVHGQTLTVTHDDGATLIVDGQTIFSAPGPLDPSVSSGVYNGPSGNEEFSLIFSDAPTSDNRAILQMDLTPPGTDNGQGPGSPVPEPGSWVLMASGLATAGLKLRRKQASQA